MSEESTRELPDRVSFEQRVFARFDSLDRHFDGVDSRLDGLEARLEKLESQSYDTKPIWERALKEIQDTQSEVGELTKGFKGVETKVDGIETKVDELQTRLGALEVEVAGLRSDYGGLHNELIESQRDFKAKLNRRIDLVLEVFLDTRNNMRDSDERLTRLESKLA